jgi:hypothetical protein
MAGAMRLTLKELHAIAEALGFRLAGDLGHDFETEQDADEAVAAATPAEQREALAREEEELNAALAAK